MAKLVTLASSACHGRRLVPHGGCEYYDGEGWVGLYQLIVRKVTAIYGDCPPGRFILQLLSLHRFHADPSEHIITVHNDMATSTELPCLTPARALSSLDPLTGTLQ